MSTLKKSMYGLDAILHVDNHGGDDLVFDHNSEPPAGPNGPLVLHTIASPSLSDNIGDTRGAGPRKISAGDVQSESVSTGADTSATGAAPRTAGSRYPNFVSYTSTPNVGKSLTADIQRTEPYYQLLPVSAHAPRSSSGRAHKAPLVHTPARCNWQCEAWLVLTWHGFEAVRLVSLKAFRLGIVVINRMAQQIDVLPLHVGSIRV
ncbi:unnamed protein product [Rhizoctonia solani]|uniref:Uncharacterized protein n=1 Tax=Rhizoctonia solani TaxID=456999 RepID=A0A8H3BSX1_9AGAM|nr:unnamed protein product [Rhizoctonia solani]